MFEEFKLCNIIITNKLTGEEISKPDIIIKMNVKWHISIRFMYAKGFIAGHYGLNCDYKIKFNAYQIVKPYGLDYEF